MATRAERFKSTTARQAQIKNQSSQPVAASRKPSAAKRLAQIAAADERRLGGPASAPRNSSLGKKAIYKLEGTLAPLRPSRKSSRGGKNRAKAATPLTGRQKLKLNSPAQKHDRGK